MSARSGHQEYVVCIDSRNRDLKLYPQPNDFKLPINFPRGLPITRLSLGSIELPLPQYIIEEAWNRIYLSEGLSLIVNSENQECLRRFTIREYDGTVVEVIVPIYLNEFVNIDATDPNSPIFETAFEHGLDLRSQWNWGAPIRIISTSLTDPDVINLTPNNQYLQILSPTTFQLVNIPTPLTSPELGGYLHAPPIANPQKLADMITFGLNNSAVVANFEYLVEFDGCTNQFCVKMPTNSECLGNFPPAVILSSGSTNCLTYLMGFGCTDLPLPSDPKKAACEGVCGQFCYQCFSYVALTPGNYNVESFPAEFATQANRFYFEPGCRPGTSAIGIPVPPPTLVFSDKCGICQVVTIPFGKYCPEQFALALQTAMNGTSATNDYRVEYLADCGQFRFSTVSGATFGLEFDDPRNAGASFIGISSGARQITMQQRLGFTNGCYRGSNMYISNLPFHLPTKGCSSTSIPERCLSNVIVPLLSRSKKEIGVNACQPKVVEGTLTDVGGGIGRIESMIVQGDPPAVVPYAHGFQPEDVVTICDPATGDAYEVVVSTVIDATTFEVEIAGVTALIGAANLNVCVSLFGPVILNLFFGSICSVGNTSNNQPNACNNYSNLNNASCSSSSGFPSTPLASCQSNCPPSSVSTCTTSAGFHGPKTNSNLIRSEISGFPPTAVLWNGVGCLPFFAPNQFNLDPPAYLLVQLVEPSESRYIQHTYKNETLTNILAKIVAYPPLRVERAIPMEAIFQGLQVINQIHIRILNPDHSLYHFHGLNWSASLIFIASASSGSQICY